MGSQCLALSKLWFFTVKALCSSFSCRGISSAPHVASSFLGHVPLRAWSEEASREASQGVGPGSGGAINGATIYPGAHQVDLYCIASMSHTSQEKTFLYKTAHAAVCTETHLLWRLQQDLRRNTSLQWSRLNWYLYARVTGTLSWLFVPWSSLEGQEDFPGGGRVKDRVTFWDWDVHELRWATRNSWVKDFKCNMITWKNGK